MKYKLPKTEKIVPIQPSCKKTIYDTKADAEEAIRYVTENRRVNLSAYKCTICGFWHLTSK